MTNIRVCRCGTALECENSRTWWTQIDQATCLHVSFAHKARSPCWARALCELHGHSALSWSVLGQKARQAAVTQFRHKRCGQHDVARLDVAVIAGPLGIVMMQVAHRHQQTGYDATSASPAELLGFLVVHQMGVQAALRLELIDQDGTISVKTVSQQGNDVGMDKVGQHLSPW